MMKINPNIIGAGLLALGAYWFLGSNAESNPNSCIDKKFYSQSKMTEYFNSCSKPINVLVCHKTFAESMAETTLGVKRGSCRTKTAYKGDSVFIQTYADSSKSWLDNAPTTAELSMAACFAPKTPSLKSNEFVCN